MDTSLLALFTALFDPARILLLAREVGAVKRLREIHPCDFCRAVLACAMGDEVRSIASARRKYQELTGAMPEESSFYNRFSEPMRRLMVNLFQQALNDTTRTRRDAVEKALGRKGILDVIAIDGSQVALPPGAAGVFPSTDKEHGGLKLTVLLSLMFQSVKGVVMTDAKTHDRKALRLDRWLHGLLLLFDRGYSDYRLFDAIVRRGGFFITRLKISASPVIAAIHSGLGQAWVGVKLARDLPIRGVLDIDALFHFKGGQRVLRVIRVTVRHEVGNGRVEDIEVWLVTNLSRALFTAAQVAMLYRMRWEIEKLFRALKHVGRLDQLQSSNATIIRIFLLATLIGLLLAQDICARMRMARPDREPSLERVMTLVLSNLPRLADAFMTGRQKEVLARFEATLWREGVNPNPGRPYATARYAMAVG